MEGPQHCSAAHRPYGRLGMLHDYFHLDPLPTEKCYHMKYCHYTLITFKELIYSNHFRCTLGIECVYKKDTLVNKCLCHTGQDRRNTLTNPRCLLRPSKSSLLTMRFPIIILCLVITCIFTIQEK